MKVVHVDNETLRNCRNYKKKTEEAAIANINRDGDHQHDESKSTEKETKTESGKIKGSKKSEKSPAKKISKRNRRGDEGNVFLVEETEPEAVEHFNEEVEFVEDDQVVRMQVDRGSESYGESSSDPEEDNDKVDHEISFKSIRD